MTVRIFYADRNSHVLQNRIYLSLSDKETCITQSREKLTLIFYCNNIILFNREPPVQPLFCLFYKKTYIHAEYCHCSA